MNTDIKYKADGETDTEQLLRAIETKGIIKGIQSTSGSMAIAFMWRYNLRKFYLYRHSEPLAVAWDKRFFCFASTSDILRQAIPGMRVYLTISEDMLYEVSLGKKLIFRELKKIEPKRGWGGCYSWGWRDKWWAKDKKTDDKGVLWDSEHEAPEGPTSYAEALIANRFT